MLYLCRHAIRKNLHKFFQYSFFGSLPPVKNSYVVRKPVRFHGMAVINRPEEIREKGARKVKRKRFFKQYVKNERAV